MMTIYLWFNFYKFYFDSSDFSIIFYKYVDVKTCSESGIFLYYYNKLENRNTTNKHIKITNFVSMLHTKILIKKITSCGNSRYHLKSFEMHFFLVRRSLKDFLANTQWE